MGSVVSLSRGRTREKRGRVAEIRRSTEQEYKPTFPVDIQALLDEDVYPSLQKFLLFWTMMDTIKVHGYLRASMGAIGRATVGAWWKLSKHEYWGDEATEDQYKELLNFYSTTERSWDNIKDYQSLAFKLTIGAMYLRFFGQVAYNIVRNNTGKAIGLDHLPGLVIPNVDEYGYFKNPAFVQYPGRDPRINSQFIDPRDIVFITNPDWEGSPLGGSDIEALTEYNLPVDIYLQTAAREYLKKSSRPELIYMLPQDISDEAFDTFVELISSRYAGASNIGRNPVAVQGELKVERIDDLPSALPYQESRKQSREETLAVTGVNGPVLGIGETLSSANIRESRRQVHETTMEPLFKMIELGFYEQIHVREFGITGWTPKFNNPDFLTAVERATVHMRDIQFGVLSPNEAREDLGLEPREDGDDFVVPQGYGGDSTEPQGSPPEGREPEPDDGEPSNDDQDPPRGDQHDDETERALDILSDDGLLFGTEVSIDGKHWAGPRITAESFDEAEEKVDNAEISLVGQLIDEFQAWKKFAASRIKRGMRLREYHTKYIPQDISELMQERLEKVRTVEELDVIFDELFETLQEIQNEQG